MNPTSFQAWLNVACERAGDARHLTPDRPLAAVYMAGYALECAFKALLNRLGLPLPAYGPEGHNLRALWAAAERRVAALADRQGHQSWFLLNWSTDLRYATALPNGANAVALVNAACALLSKLCAVIPTLRRR